MVETIQVIIENDSSCCEIVMGSRLSDIAQSRGIKLSHPILAAYVNNRIRELNYKLYSEATIRFVDFSSFTGMRVYQRTLWLILQYVVEKLYPTRHLKISHSMGVNGFYCEVSGKENFSTIEIEQLRLHIQKTIEEDKPIVRKKLPTDKVAQIYQEKGYLNRLQLLRTRPRLYSEIYTLDTTVGYFYGSLSTSTGCISCFDIKSYYRGFYLALPQRDNPASISISPHQEKMFEIFNEYKHWGDIIGVSTVGSLNSKVMAGESSSLIKIAEALHEKKIISLADKISHANKELNTHIVLLSGPSSSGKTSTSKRLDIQLRVNGYQPIVISLDDYFVDREYTPKDENGEYDFEALEAVDVPLFNTHLNALLAGEEVEIPHYNFITGGREYCGNKLRLNEKSIIIIEGIHGLNPSLTPSINDSEIFRVYVSCFTTMAMDNTSRIATSDNRLLRRLTRDFMTRGNNGLSTLERWESVRRGEEKHIFPYQENADVMFNSSLFYEIPVIKHFVEPILHTIPDTSIHFEEARRLIKFLDNFIPIDHKEIPPTSLLREFIGGSSFKY